MFFFLSSKISQNLFNRDVTRQEVFPSFLKAVNECLQLAIIAKVEPTGFFHCFSRTDTHTRSQKTGSFFSSFIRLFPFYRFTFLLLSLFALVVVALFMISKKRIFLLYLDIYIYKVFLWVVWVSKCIWDHKRGGKKV